MILKNKNILIAIVVTFVATASLIYLTPLKWVTFVEPTVRDIHPREFYEEYIKNPEGYVFIDVRPEESFNRVHAKDSTSIPLLLLYDARHTLPKKDKEIVIICSGGRASGIAYSYLQHHGFFNIWRIEGGIEYWMAEGLPVEGTGIESIPRETVSSAPHGAICA